MLKDDELTKYMMVIEQYKEQLNNLETQYSYLQAAILEYNKAKLTIEKLNESEKDSEILFPIGGGAFIEGSAKNKSKILIDIGSGLVTEKKSDEAIKKVEKRIEELNKTQQRVAEMMEQLQAEATEITAKVQKLYEENQKEQ